MTYVDSVPVDSMPVHKKQNTDEDVLDPLHLPNVPSTNFNLPRACNHRAYINCSHRRARCIARVAAWRKRRDK